MYNRREIGTITLAGLAAPLAGLLVHGDTEVHVGVNTSSFRDLTRASERDPIDTLIEALDACGVRDCELSARQVEPRYGNGHAAHHTMSSMSPQMMRRELRKWRLRTPRSYFAAIGARFQKAGIRIHAYNYSPDRSFTDEEMNQGFVAAKAIGAELITAAAMADVASRMAPFAERHRMVVAILDRQGTAAAASVPSRRPEAVTNLSGYFKVNLDIGSCTAADIDPLVFLREHHAAIRTVRLNDRRRNGDSVQWGQGDAPIREVLKLLKREGWPIRAYVDYDYDGQATPVEEVKRCLAYAKQALG